MRTVQVERTLQAPIQTAFDLLTDHANYKQFPGISDSELLQEGDRDRNGVDAIRRVVVGPLRFEEEITEFDSPNRMSYVIRKINVPFEHHGGRISLKEYGAVTHATWTSTFRVPVPVIGGAVERLIWSPALSRGFKRVLEDVDRLAD
jgi:uncharacterized protein YndB with AHSA1/START domain